jgi:hypothetical protein
MKLRMRLVPILLASCAAVLISATVLLSARTNEIQLTSRYHRTSNHRRLKRTDTKNAFCHLMGFLKPLRHVSGLQ